MKKNMIIALGFFDGVHLGHQALLAECVRLGFTEIVLPKQNLKKIPPMEGVKLIGVDTLMQALAVIS